jgi:hypothetical protein
VTILYSVDDIHYYLFNTHETPLLKGNNKKTVLDMDEWVSGRALA